MERKRAKKGKEGIGKLITKGEFRIDFRYFFSYKIGKKDIQAKSRKF